MPLSLPNKDKKKKKIDEVEERLSPKKVSDLSFSEARAIREQYGSLKNYELATDKNRAKRIDEQMQDLNARRLVDAATSRGTPVEAESYGKNNKWNDYTTVMSERKTDYDRAVEKLKKDLDVYSPVADVSGVKNYLDATKAGYDNAVALGKSAADFGNAFKSADDFKRWSIGWDGRREGDKTFVDDDEKKEAREEYYKNIVNEIGELVNQLEFHDYKGRTPEEIQDRIDQLTAEKLRYERFDQIGREDDKLRSSPDFAEKSAFNYSGTPASATNIDVYERLARGNAESGYGGLTDEEAYINSLAGIDEEGQYKKTTEKEKERTSWMSIDPDRVFREAAHVENTPLGVYQEGDTPIARYLDDYKKEKKQKVSDAQANGATIAPMPDNINPGPRRADESFDIVGEYILARNEETDSNPFVYVGGNLINILDYGDGMNLDFMTEDDLATYRYVLNTQGATAAKTWLDNHRDIFVRRADAAYREKLKDESALGLAARSIASVPENLVGGIGAFIGTALGDGSYDSTSWMQRRAEGARAETAQRIDKATGDANLFGFSFGDVYQSLMSGADSLAGAALLGKGYTYVMGTGAAASKARTLYDQGATEEQIHKGAFVAGLTEILTEKVSVEVFFSNFMQSVTKSGWQGALKVATQAFTEGTEEMASDALNAVFDNIIRRSQSDWNQTIQRALDEGKTRKEAERLVWTDFANQLWQSFAGGALSGGTMAGPGTIASGIEYGRATKAEGNYIIDSEGVEALRNIANEMTDAPKSISKLIEKTGKKPTAKNVGRLSRALEQTIINETDAETRFEKGAKYAFAREGVDLSDVKAREGTNLYNNVDVSEKISDTGTTVETETGGEITIDEKNPITQRDGKTYLNTSAGEILQDDIKYSSEKEAQLYEYVSDLPQSVANAIVENYKGQENVRGYVNGMRDGILLYGYNNIENAPKNTAFATLDKADQQYAMKVGRLLAAEDLNNVKPQTVGNHVAVKETATTSGETVMNFESIGLNKAALKELGISNPYAVATKRGAGGTGGVVYTKGDVDLNSAMGRADGLLAYVYSSIAGNSVVLYDSKTVKDADLKNANGKHVASDGTIYLDIRAEAGKNVTGGIAYTLGHELTHEAEQWAKKEYAAFRKFLYENYVEKGTAVEDLIAKKMSDLDTTDRAYAESEVVADACERMLLDSDAMEKLAELQDKEPGTFKKIVDFIKRALEKIVGKFNSIREVYETLGAENTRIESKLVQEFGDNLKKLQDMWSGMVVKAAQNRAAAVERGGQTAKTTEQYSTKQEVLALKNVDWTADDSTIKEEITAHIKKVNALNPVAIVQFSATRESKLAEIMKQTVSRLGGERIVRDGISFAFDGKSISNILNHAKTDEKCAAALSAPYVSKYGERIAGQKNHKKRGVVTLTYAAPVVINDDTVNVGVSIHFTNDGRAYAASVETQSAKPFVLNKKNAPAGIDSRVDRYNPGTALPATDASEDIVTQSFEKSNTFEGKTSDQFSMKQPVERTDRLIAWHNMSEEALESALELGGLAMPSWAIKPADRGHTTYGKVSVIASRSLVDPKQNRNSLIFGGDAWTPVFPEVNYKVTNESAGKLEEEIVGLVGQDLYRQMGGSALDHDNISDQLKRADGGLPTYYKDNSLLRYAYLKSIGENIEVPQKEDNLYYGGEYSNDQVREFAGKLTDGKRTLEKYMNMSSTELMAQEDLKQAIADIRKNEYREKIGADDKIFKQLDDEGFFSKDKVDFTTVDRMLNAARKYFDRGISQTVDKKALGEIVDRKIDNAEYERWIKQKLNDTVERKGIRNNKDVFTSTGNRRGFDALNYEYTLANVVKAMKSQPRQGRAQFLSGPGSVKGAALKQYSNIEEARKDRGRIVDDEEAGKAAYEAYNQNLADILDRMSKNTDRFDTADALIEVLQHAKTENGIYNYMQRELSQWYNVSQELAHDIYLLIGQINSLPMEYFEGKTYDAVTFDQTAAVVVPNTMDAALKSRLSDAGANVIEYKAGDEDSRLKAVNSVEEAKFSRKSSESYAVRDIVDRALKRLDPSSAEYRAMAKYKAELDTLDNMRAQLDEAIKSGDRQAQTRLTNNIKTQRGILNRIENSASMKNVASMRDVTRLADDAKKLREMLKLQGRETNGTIAKQRSVNAAASEIMEKYGIKRGKGELAELLGNYYTKMMQSVNNETMTRDAALDQAREAAEWIARHVPDEIQYDDGTIEALDMLRGYKVKLNDNQRQNIRARYDDINGWRRAVGGYITLSNEGKYLDELWPEWAERAPGYFTNETISGADMPERLAEIIDSLKKSRETVIEVPGQYEYDLDRAANDVYEAFWNIEPEQTVADKYAERIKTLKAEHNAMMSDLRKSFRDTIREETREAYREGKQKAREYTRKIEVRRKVKKLAERLADIYNKPKVNKYVPVELAKPTVELLKELDFETGRASKLAEKFGNLKLQYDAMMKGDEGKATYPQEISDLIEKMRTEVKGMVVKDMTADQLEDIYTTLKAFDHVLKTAREARNLSSSIGEDMTIYEAGEKWINEISETKEAKSLINKYTQQMLTPREFFERLASYKKNSISEKVFDMLNRAERKQAEIEMRSNMIFDDIMKNVKYLSQLSSTKNLVDIGLKDSNGNAVPITRGMMLAYYMHTLNEDNARHVAIGGMKAPDLKQYYKGDVDSYSNGKRIPGLVGAELAAQYEKIHDTLEGKRNKDGTRSGGLNEELQDAMDRNNSERVEELLEQRNQLWAERDEIIARGMRMIDQQRKAIEEMLTDEDKAFIKATQDYFENYSKDVLNEATMQMYGFEKARVENYFPIHSDANFLKAAFETVTNDASLENKGFMKDRVKAANPIMLEDFSSVINSQIQKTAQYAAFAPILREFNKLYSVKTGGVAAVDSVMEAIDEKFGQAGTKYISNLVADMNGARRRDTTFLDRARSNFAGAVLTLNPRVSMVQAASYPSAAAVVGHKALAKALALPDNSVVFKRANQELISKYTARLWQRNQGGADVTLHDAKSVNSLYSRANRRLRFLTGWIEAVDAGTVGRLWYASEYYVRDHFKNLERGTDEYYEKTAEVFNEVVERTQPNYTTLQRPDILRNPNQLVRSLTMFMTQRLQNFNIVYSAARRYAKYSSDLKQNKNDVTREDVREARGNLTRAITSQAVATAALAGIKLLADALLHNFRRRKDEETGDITAESVLMSTVDDFIGSLFSDIVGGSEAYDIVKSIVTGGKYYEPEIGGIGTFVDTAKDAVNLSQKIMGKDNPSANDFIKLGYNLAQIFGIPAENGGKIGKALWNHVQDIKNGEFGSFNAGDAKTEKQKGVAAYRAYERGDMDTYEEISSTMKNPKDAMKYGTGSSYGKFDEAVETGEDLGGVIDEYLDMGYTEEGLAAQITRDFKQKYRNASDKASLKRKLLDAYEELGYDRDKKSKDIDKWLED